MKTMDEYDLMIKMQDIATRAHKGQFRKFGNKEPYINHPRRVSGKVKSFKEKQVAWGHDLIEDTEVTEEQLREEGFDEEVVSAIVALTRKDDETYYDFILRIMDNDLARVVKIADIEDNISDNLKEGSLKDKYRLARHLLRAKAVSDNS